MTTIDLDRAKQLVHLADAIDRLVEGRLSDLRRLPRRNDRDRVCDRLLERTLHQLHNAAIELRGTAATLRTEPLP